MDQRVRRAISLMREDLSRKVATSEIASAVNLSPAHLRYLFRTETGMSPAQYLRALRMEEAGRLLASTFLNVKEVAHRTGLGDKSHFTRDFKKVYGLTPARYRARQHHAVESASDPDAG